MKILLTSSIIMLALDSAFLYLITPLFKRQIKAVQKSPLELNMTGTIISYLFLILGLNYFILKDHKSVMDAYILGLVIYGVYEGTSMALLKDWRLETLLLDTAWGGVLFAGTTYLTYSLYN